MGKFIVLNTKYLRGGQPPVAPFEHVPAPPEIGVNSNTTIKEIPAIFLAPLARETAVELTLKNGFSLSFD